MNFNFKYASWMTTLTVFTVLAAIVYQGFLESRKLNKITTILTNLVYLENNFEKQEEVIKPRILVAYGSCSDLYIQAPEFLNYTESLVSDFQNRDENDDEINTEQDFYRSFAYYFSKGAAAERYTPNTEFFQKLIKLAKKHESHRWALGGNAPLMSNRFAKEGADVMLVATMSKKLRTHLHENVKLVSGDTDHKDDVHLILEYKTGDQWGDLVSPRANRYILHSDYNNPMMKSLELMKMNDFDPRLFVISGVHMMDNFPFENMAYRDERLKMLQYQMNAQKQSTLIHFEMASFVDIELINSVLKYIIPYTDSIGMNEQEVDNILRVLEEGKISLSADSNPRVATTLNQMRRMFKILNGNFFDNVKVDKNRRLLSRIHVHTLAYQAIMVVKSSDWKHTKNAVAKAALTANRHVCGSNVVNPENAYLILDDSFATSSVDENEDTSRPKRINFKDSEPVACWNETITVKPENKLQVEICISPVLVCRRAIQTAGAGDNISSSGLVLQI
jgi:ADP-dependent glucokinase